MTQQSRTIITYKGQEIAADAAANLMDDELREAIADGFIGDTEQEFFDEYVAAHLAKFGTEFVIN